VRFISAHVDRWTSSRPAPLSTQNRPVEIAQEGTIDVKLEVVTLAVTAQSASTKASRRALAAGIVRGDNVRAVQLTPYRSVFSMSSERV
jgi:hypothetical protein